MKIVVVLLLFIFTGCTFVQSKYTTPRDRGSLNKKTFKVDESFDAVWQSLTRYFPRKFFSIKYSEKKSGLFTLSFGGARPERYVDCGDIYGDDFKNKWSFLMDSKTTGTVELLGTVNIIVKPIDSSNTSVSLSTSYILNINDKNLSKQTWNFDTNGKQSKKLGELEITCMPTFYAENDIIAGINSISPRH